MLIYAFLACLGAHFCEYLQVLFALQCFSPAGVSAYRQAKHMALQSHFTQRLAVKIGIIKGRGSASKESLISRSAQVKFVAILKNDAAHTNYRRSCFTGTGWRWWGGAAAAAVWVVDRLLLPHVTFIVILTTKQQFSWFSCPAVLTKPWPTRPAGVCPHPLLCERACANSITKSHRSDFHYSSRC